MINLRKSSQLAEEIRAVKQQDYNGPLSVSIVDCGDTVVYNGFLISKSLFLAVFRAAYSVCDPEEPMKKAAYVASCLNIPWRTYMFSKEVEFPFIDGSYSDLSRRDKVSEFFLVDAGERLNSSSQKSFTGAHAFLCVAIVLLLAFLLSKKKGAQDEDHLRLPDRFQ